MKREKVGILTFHQAINYGAVLQAYALKEVCNDLGYEAHIIDYEIGKGAKPAPFHEFLNSSSKKTGAIKLIRNMMSYFGDAQRWKLFKDFREKYLSESKCCKSEKDIAQLGYDFYIAGSDQIWNYRITCEQFNPVFFLEFDTDAKKIIYAASSQDTPFPLDKELEFKAMLEKLDAAVGIREPKLADYVAELIHTQYPVVLDPTLLAGRSVLERLPDTDIPDKPYILIYQIDSNPASDISVKNLERQFGCDVYTMTVPRIGSVHGRKGIAGPEKFLSLLKNAQLLVTNSFHGIALSLLFEKQFFVYENGGVMSRIDSLLTAVNLCDRKVKMVADIEPNQKIDYGPVNEQLALLRQRSQEFLRRAFSGEHMLTEFTEKKTTIFPMNERKKEDCCGCSACADVCPVNAIEMKEDEEGFVYPFVRGEACIHCGKCDRTCGFIPVCKREAPYELPKAYGVKHKNDTIRESSRSGAAFIAFSDIILEQDGIVYGAAMQKDFSVRHVRAANKVERDDMKKAKYVQSNTIGIYPKVEKDLREEKQVLFSGTPCQVAGLHAYLNEKQVDESRLICCDLVCHGVPSPAIWKDYLEYICKKYGKKILVANFRDKEFGWDSHCESFVLENRRKKIVSRDYTDLFYQHIMFRPSCHNCPFANVYRPGDLTLADFWGIEKNDESFNDNRGVSLVLVNTEKGMSLFKQAQKAFHYFECKVENCIQPTLVKPSTVSPRREMFWDDYKKMEFSSFLKKYTTPLTMLSKIKKLAKETLYHVGVRKHP